MAILNKKPKGPTYTGNGDEVTIPFPVKKQDGYYTNMKDLFEDGMKSQHKEDKKELTVDKMLDHIIKTEGGTPEKYKELMNHIAFHESAGTMDPKLKQYGGGPGRGVYQFERGKDAGAKIAVKHTKKILGR